MKASAALALLVVAWCSNVNSMPQSCVPTDYLEIDGIGLGDNNEELMSLGTPMGVASYTGEDDGGQYTGTRFTFLKVQIDIGPRRGVERIATKDPTAQLPAGIRIGMPFSEVQERLRFTSADRVGANEVALPTCGTYEGTELRFQFSSEPLGGLLEQMELVQYGP